MLGFMPRNANNKYNLSINICLCVALTVTYIYLRIDSRVMV